MKKLLLIIGLAFSGVASAQTISTYTLTEQFSTNWPIQPIEFPTSLTSDPGTADKVMLSINGGGATEVFYQWEPVSVCYGQPMTAGGCIIVAFSPLNANETRTWTLQVGTKTASAPSNPAAMATVGNNIEVTNGLTGVRIVTAAANTSPFNQAPIQGIQLVSGTWTGAGASPNLFYTESSGFAGDCRSTLQTPAYTATGYSVSTIVSGALKTVLQTTTTWNRPRYYCSTSPTATLNSTVNIILSSGLGVAVGDTITGTGIPGGTTIVSGSGVNWVMSAAATISGSEAVIITTTINPSGTGHYTGTYTIWAGLKEVGIDEDTDMQQQYFIPTYAQIPADTERHRGANSYSQQFGGGTTGGTIDGDPRCGYNPMGTITGATSASPVVLTLNSAIAVNGHHVEIQGISPTLTDGLYYVAFISGTSYGVYSDANLTMPVMGGGTYPGGGTVRPAYLGYAYGGNDFDAQMDLTYSTDRQNHYFCSFGYGGSTDGYAQMPSNYPTNSKSGGFYSFIYNSAGSGTSDFIGIYEGQVGLIAGVGLTFSEPGIYTSNNHFITSAIAGGIQVFTNTAGNTTGSYASSFHRNWGIYIDQNANLPPQAIGLEPIGNIQNILTGINLSDIANYDLIFPDPSGGWTPLYLTQSAYNTLQGWVNNGTSKCGSTNCYYNLLNAGDGSTFGTGLLNLWQTNTTAGVTTALNSMLGGGVNSFASFSNSLANGDNHWGDTYGFYQLGNDVTSVATPLLNAILLNSNSTTAQKNQAKAMFSFGGNTLWDPNWWNPNTGEGTGNGNQNSQFYQYQAQMVSSIPSQPYLSQFLATGIANVQSSFTSNWNPSGAVPGDTWYQSTFTEPTGENYLSLTRTGNLDFSSPTWQTYALWELSTLTPPEPRFGGTTGSGGLAIPMRKLYSNGDGNTAATGAVRMGIMANALQSVNATLAGQLQFGFNSTNSPTIITNDHQFLSTTSVIDPTITPITPTLASINVPGYHSSERFNFGTANETALWFINGGLYSTNGHRHADDGQVSAYALGAPLAIDWNANLYSPETPGRFMHDSVVFDSELSPAVWSADTPSLSAVNAALGSPTNTEFINVSASTHSTGTFTLPADGTTWTRSVRTMNFNPAYPIIYVEDTFSGTSATAGKTLTWNLMATGNVTSPAGSISPTVRLSTGCQSPAGQLPSNGAVNNLASGLNNFNFTGFTWAAHPAGGINWDLWLNPGTGTTQQYLIGNWGHGCQNARESGEYNTANSAAFKESQHILRVHDPGTSPSFITIIAPYNKGATPTRTVSAAGLGTQIVQGTQTTTWNDSVAEFSDSATGVKNLTTYDTSTVTALGVTVTGGSQEVAIASPTSITWTVSGATTGTRQFTPPAGSWVVSPPLTPSGGVYSVAFTGGLQAAPQAFQFTSGLTAVASPVAGGKGVGAGSSIQ